MIEIGMSYTVELLAQECDTARVIGSGELDVLATPKMCALMEKAAYMCISNELEQGASSVGTSLNIKHLSATPVGMKVSATATVTAVDGRKVSFHLTASDEAGVIGEGEHERFIVYKEKFLSKTYSKLESK